MENIQTNDMTQATNGQANGINNGAPAAESASPETAEIQVTPEAVTTPDASSPEPQSAVSESAVPADVTAQDAAEPPQTVASEIDTPMAAPVSQEQVAPPQSTEAPAAPEPAAPAAPEPAAPARAGRAFSMAQVMESDEFSSYMSGVDALSRGAVLRGIVVRADENTGEVLVDIGTKSEGIVSRSELGDDPVNVGDEIEVTVLRPEDDEGHPVLSKRRADFEKIWRLVQEAKDKQTNIEGTVIKEVKGGLIVNLGVEAFVPASHVDARNRGDLSRFVGRTIPLRVIEIDRKKNKVIGSHRLAAEEDRQKREEEVFGTLQKDQIVEGVVRRITDFGAFVDIGGIDGLLHVREMGWNRVEHPDQVVKKGQKLQVLVLEVDRERKRVALGLKQLQSDPWKKAAENYKPGQIITGTVVRIAPSCAFVQLEEGVEGIIPISEMSEERIKTPEDVLAVGQQVEARVKQNQANQRRITLSLRAAVQERERRETREVVRQVNTRASADEGLRLGDVFGTQLRAARDRGKERNEARAVQDRKAAKSRALEAAEAEELDVDDDLDTGDDDLNTVEDVAMDDIDNGDENVAVEDVAVEPVAVTEIAVEHTVAESASDEMSSDIVKSDEA